MLKNQIKISILVGNLKYNQLLLFKNQKNNTGTTESISLTEVTGISFPTSSALLPGITTPLQVPQKTIPSNSDIYFEPNKSEKLTSQDNSSGVTSHQLHIQNAGSLSFSQFNRTMWNLPIYNPFTDYINQIQSHLTVTIGPNRSDDQRFMLNTKTYNCFYAVNTPLGIAE